VTPSILGSASISASVRRHWQLLKCSGVATIPRTRPITSPESGASSGCHTHRTHRADEGARPRGCLAGITVNVVAPRSVVTELTDGLPDSVKDANKAARPLGHFGSTDDIAAAVAFLASDEAAYITRQVLGVDGGLAMM
jgi:NAD(P)-dependent dehydrogenase (short-subunit alcohol dehydrogenase family)